MNARPPSVVCRIEPQGPGWVEPQGPAPSSHQVSSLIAVTDWGAKCGGTVAGVTGVAWVVAGGAVFAMEAALVAVCWLAAVVAVGCGLPLCKLPSRIATTATTAATPANTARASV